MIVTQICFSLLFSLTFRAAGIISFPIEARHLRGCLVLATVWCAHALTLTRDSFRSSVRGGNLYWLG